MSWPLQERCRFPLPTQLMLVVIATAISKPLGFSELKARLSESF